MSLDALLDADFKTKCYDHQLREFEISADLECRALLWSMRTGKSKLIIDTACHLYRAGKIDGVLIIAPNGVHSNWIHREIPIHQWDSVPYVCLEWISQIAGKTGKKSRPRMHRKFWEKAEYISLEVKDKLKFVAMNAESIIFEANRELFRLYLMNNRILAVFDESHYFRKPSASRTKLARSLIQVCPYKRILTGTVVTNSPFAAYSQYNLLKPEALGFPTYQKFQRHYGDYQRIQIDAGRFMYGEFIGYKNLEDLRARIAKYSSVVLREDCVDLPAVNQHLVQSHMSEDQKRVYKDISKGFLTELADEKISIGILTSVMLKLQQIACGFLIDENKVIHNIPGGESRLNTLMQEIESTPDKVIVWCSFREDIRRVVKRLESAKIGFVEYHGGTKRADREEARKLFGPDSNFFEDQVKVFVGQPVAGGIGLNLSGAHTMIWYSHTFDAIIREQATERASAIGGKNVTVIDIVSSPIDRLMLSMVEEKIKTADLVSGTKLQEFLETGINSLEE